MILKCYFLWGVCGSGEATSVVYGRGGGGVGFSPNNGKIKEFEWKWVRRKFYISNKQKTK